MIAIFAPKTAALDTPRVEGDAIELFKDVCITRPAIDNPPPITRPANTLGTLILWIIKIVDFSPLLNKAKTLSLKEIDDGPINTLKKNKIIRAKSKTIKEIIIFFLLEVYESFLIKFLVREFFTQLFYLFL